MNIQDWFPLGWTGLISLQSRGLSRIQHHSFEASFLWCSAFFMVQLSHQIQYYSSTIYRKQFMHKTTLTTGKQFRLWFLFVDSITVIVVSKWRSGPMKRLQFQCEELLEAVWKETEYAIQRTASWPNSTTILGKSSDFFWKFNLSSYLEYCFTLKPWDLNHKNLLYSLSSH